jgi:hypothetical protein
VDYRSGEAVRVYAIVILVTTRTVGPEKAGESICEVSVQFFLGRQVSLVGEFIASLLPSKLRL